MPIAQNNTRVSIDFQYEFEIEGRTILYNLKFINTENGPMLQISPEGYSDYFELPALMFLEVSNFLQSQGVFNKTVKLSANNSDSPTVTPQQQPQGLFPTLIRKNKNSNTVDPTSTLTHLASQPQPENAEKVVKHNLSEEEISNIAKQRLAAKAKANTAKKVKKADEEKE